MSDDNVVDNNTEAELDTSVESDETKKGIVLYSDGSCRPQPGFTGWGVHGYMFDYVECKKPSTVNNCIITNKGYIRNSLPANKDEQAPIPVTPSHYFDFLGSSPVQGTNNEAEVKALVYALERIVDYKPVTIHILTDSEYAKNGATTWNDKWAETKWRKQDGSYVANHEWWVRLHAIMKKLTDNDTVISIAWVKAHNGDHGNTIADILSVIAMNYSSYRQSRGEYQVSDAKGYWKNEVEKHPFINFKRIYFNSVEKFNTPGQYFQADPGGGDFVIGKRIPETGFSVIRLKNPDKVIEDVKVKQYEAANDINAVIMMKLDAVYNKDIYPHLASHGKYCMIGNRNNLNLEFVDRRPITVEINPTGLSLRALESFNFLEDLLATFQLYRETGFDNSDNNIQLNAHDITETIYNRTEKMVKKSMMVKHVLKPEYGVGVKDMYVEVEELFDGKPISLKIPMIFGTDILPRNNLKHLEDENPSIYLITWRESASSVRYATIAECESGIGIWSNFFADRIFLNRG